MPSYRLVIFKAWCKYKEENLFCLGIWKAIGKKIRIRTRNLIVWARGSGSVTKRHGSGTLLKTETNWIQIYNLFQKFQKGFFGLSDGLPSYKRSLQPFRAYTRIHPALKKINFLIGISVTFFPFWIRILILNLDPNLQNCSYLYVKNVASNSQS